MSEKKTIAWTGAQRAAIDHREGNLVVSASAGAGKTAVLAERVLSLLADASQGAAPRLDEMLVITFTEKAARQMRERIEERLRERLRAEPESRPLRQALDSIGAAWIMTIDAFCRRVVVEHFHRAQLPPAPRVPDGSELAELELGAIERAAETWAGGAQEKKAALAELSIALGGDLRTVADHARELIRFMETLDRPEKWRERARGRIAQTLAARDYAGLPEATEAAAAAARGAKELADAWRGVLRRARRIGADGGTLAQWEGLADRLEHLIAPDRPLACDALAAELEVYDEVLGKLTNQGVCGSLYKTPLRERELEPLKKAFLRWRRRWFGLDEAGLLLGARLAARQAGALCDLADEAAETIRRRKLRRGLATFNDFERHALEILSEPGGDGPSDIALQYRDRFRVVLVDEYQDTSPLQDAIVRRVAREDDPGNLFLVGDYKQSIYRFRHADPLLLREKLELADGGQGYRRIDLAENFRSRPELIEFVNACFERLMDRDVGEVDYGRRERLAAGRKAEPAADPVRVEVAWLARDGKAGRQENDHDENAVDNQDGETAEPPDGVEAQAAWVARRLRALIAQGACRPGDCAILLRSLRAELDVWLAALTAAGLKVRAPGLDPLFTTQELLDLRAALSVADNPLQDLWLAALMRSPLGGFSDDDLLSIRLAHPRGHFHESAMTVARGEMGGEGACPTSDLNLRLQNFMAMVDGWRVSAMRDGALDVLDRILRETAYEAWLAGRPAAAARLENVQHLRRLVARCGQAEDGANSLARFLALIDRAAEMDEAADLPETVGDTSDQVSLLTVHKSKGLEFPVVVLPRLERRLAHQPGGGLQFDREAGLALNGIDPDSRRQYRTLAWHRLREVLERKDRSEELRLLYVALTRARDRLILVARRDRTELEREAAGEPFGALKRLGAASAAELLAPIIAHVNAAGPAWLLVHEADAPAADAPEIERPTLRRALARTGETPAGDWAAAIDELKQEAGGEVAPVEVKLMPPCDPAGALATLPAKTTVTQLRRTRREDRDAAREAELFTEVEMLGPAFTREATLSDRKPAWTAGRIKIDGAMRGSWTHALLAHVALDPVPTAASLRAAARDLIARGLIDAEGFDEQEVLGEIDFDAIEWFFASELGGGMCARPGAVSRELPFSARRPIYDLDPVAGAEHAAESFLLQGVIDAVIDEGDRATIVDYKTEYVANEYALAEQVERHRLQIETYAKCLQSIWGIKEVRAALVFLNPRRTVWI